MIPFCNRIVNSSNFLKQCAYAVIKKFPTKNNITSFMCFKYIHHGPKLSNVSDKCFEFSKKLDSIPCLTLMNENLGKVTSDLLFENNQDLLDVLNWTSKVLDYNVKNGKKIRGTAVLKAFATYNTNGDFLDKYDSEEWKLASVLAWCVEMLQAFFVVCDDIMDQSELRRGIPCWYKQPDVGLCAINDSFLLQCGIFKLLLNNFKDRESYINILHSFLEVTHKTVYGQCLDMLCNPPNKRPIFQDFTFKKYQAIVEYKTSHYTYCLPISIAMQFVGNCSDEDFNVAKNLCLQLGLYFQSQDDFLDTFGDPSVTGKYGNDIREGKCTWFAVKFLEKASDSAKQEFMKNYGTDAVDKIMQLYKDFGVKEEFNRFENQMHLEIKNAIASLDEKRGGLYYNLFSQIRKRDK